MFSVSPGASPISPNVSSYAARAQSPRSLGQPGSLEDGDASLPGPTARLHSRLVGVSQVAGKRSTNSGWWSARPLKAARTVPSGPLDVQLTMVVATAT